MKHRKLVLGLIAVSIASTMAFSVHAEDTRISIDGGNGSWHGGVDEKENEVYSKIWDHVVDGRAYQATVWVKNALGKGDENPGKTYGVNKAGELKVTYPAAYSLFSKNKAGYKDRVVVDAYARQKYQKDTTAPSSFEAEFEFTGPAEKE